MKRAYLYVLVCMIIVGGVFAFAPTSDAQVSENSFSVIIDPEIPGANTRTQLSLESFSFDLEAATVEWRVNGAVSARGIGLDSFIFTTGNVGELKTIDVVIETAQGLRIAKTLTFNPNDVDILWESVDAYAPPFYRGKTLPSPESAIRLVAVPGLAGSLRTSDRSSLIYNWELNDRIAGEASGYGKDSFIYRNSYLSTRDSVRVSIRTRDNSQAAQAIASIAMVDPSVKFYIRESNRGSHLYRSFNSATVLTQDVTVIAEPYWFSPKDLANPGNAIEWTVNGEEVGIPSDLNRLTIRRATDEAGDAVINFSLENLDRLFQSLRGSLRLTVQ